MNIDGLRIFKALKIKGLELVDRRIEKTSSRTAAITCTLRAASSLERNHHYRCDDDLAVRLLPRVINALIHIPVIRRMFTRMFAPLGTYEYVIARTKYIDEVFEKALDQQFQQILLLGAGYDTRAYRFQAKARHTRIFELDAPHTQTAKIGQLKKRHIPIPADVVFIAVDFNQDSLAQKLDMAQFEKDRKSLFVLEGLVMYLEPESVRSTFDIIQKYAGIGSWIVFDYIQASVLRHENSLYGEEGIMKTVAKAGERWRFGIEPAKAASFLSSFGFKPIDHKNAEDLERMYFQDAQGRLIARINGTHCLITAEKCKNGEFQA